jgi:four helix bundle protein
LSDSTINSYRDLRVWRAGMSLATSWYQTTSSFPREELLGLVTQIRRAATSIPANIAEGHGRENTKSFIQYLRIAQGSLKELETHLLLAVQVGLADKAKADGLLAECDALGRMLRALIRSLQSRAVPR